MSTFDDDQNTPHGIPFDASKTEPYVCSSCGNATFVQGVFLRKVSALISPTGKEGLAPFPTFMCNSCGVVPDAMIPSFIKREAANKLQTTSPTDETTTKSGLFIVR